MAEEYPIDKGAIVSAAPLDIVRDEPDFLWDVSINLWVCVKKRAGKVTSYISRRFEGSF